jgi:hypothetical protein
VPKSRGLGRRKLIIFLLLGDSKILTAEFLIIDLRRKTRKKFLMT